MPEEAQEVAETMFTTVYVNYIIHVQIHVACTCTCNAKTEQHEAYVDVWMLSCMGTTTDLLEVTKHKTCMSCM